MLSFGSWPSVEILGMKGVAVSMDEADTRVPDVEIWTDYIGRVVVLAL